MYMYILYTCTYTHTSTSGSDLDGLQLGGVGSSRLRGEGEGDGILQQVRSEVLCGGGGGRTIMTRHTYNIQWFLNQYLYIQVIKNIS